MSMKAWRLITQAQRRRRQNGFAKIDRMDVRRLLEGLEREPGDPSPGLALLASRSVDVDEAELSAVRRRALLLLATGGDPHRELELDSRAVGTVAAELDAPERRAALRAALDELRTHARDLARVRAAVDALLEDDDLAWRWVAGALLAEELIDAE